MVTLPIAILSPCPLILCRFAFWRRSNEMKYLYAGPEFINTLSLTNHYIRWVGNDFVLLFPLSSKMLLLGVFFVYQQVNLLNLPKIFANMFCDKKYHSSQWYFPHRKLRWNRHFKREPNSFIWTIWFVYSSRITKRSSTRQFFPHLLADGEKKKNRPNVLTKLKPIFWHKQNSLESVDVEQDFMRFDIDIH